MQSYPNCIGYYDAGDEVCDGNPAASDHIDRIPCAWRERCQGLKAYCSDLSVTPESITKLSSEEELIRICEENAPVTEEETISASEEEDTLEEEEDTLENLEVKVELFTERHEETEPQLPRKRKKGNPLGKRKGKRAKLSKLLTFNKKFAALLKKTFPENKVKSKAHVIAKAGTFYPVDRSRKSDYIKWYCTKQYGYDQAVASMLIKPRTGTVDLALPVPPSELPYPSVEPINNGQFKSVFKNVSLDELDSYVTLIRDLAEKGTIEIVGIN